MNNKKTQGNSNEKDIKERSFSFACRIVKLYQFLARKRGGGEVLGRQVLRSGTSIGANLEEASAGQSKADFIFKCNIALKEARETYYWLRLLMTTQIVPIGRLRQLANESNELVAILTTIVKKSRSRK
jgi:four helix bundle protein